MPLYQEFYLIQFIDLPNLILLFFLQAFIPRLVVFLLELIFIGELIFFLVLISKVEVISRLELLLIFLHWLEQPFFLLDLVSL